MPVSKSSSQHHRAKWSLRVASVEHGLTHLGFCKTGANETSFSPRLRKRAGDRSTASCDPLGLDSTQTTRAPVLNETPERAQGLQSRQVHSGQVARALLYFVPVGRQGRVVVHGRDVARVNQMRPWFRPRRGLSTPRYVRSNPFNLRGGRARVIIQPPWPS